MVTRNEALIITAAVALALAPRFEAKVQQYAQTHRTEIQMAMNELQGKPAIPFAAPEAAPESAPQTTPALAMNVEPKFEMADMREDAAPRTEMIRAEMAAMRPMIRKASRLRLAELAPQLASLRVFAAQNEGMAHVYKLKAKKCPLPPAVPATPMSGSFTIETGPQP
jgi:hypothetical protein